MQYKKNKGKFSASNGRLKAKSFSASGRLRPPDPLTTGSAPGPRWGLRPQTPVIGSRSRARHERPLFDPPLFITFRGLWLGAPSHLLPLSLISSLSPPRNSPWAKSWVAEPPSPLTLSPGKQHVTYTAMHDVWCMMTSQKLRSHRIRSHDRGTVRHSGVA